MPKIVFKHRPLLSLSPSLSVLLTFSSIRKHMFSCSFQLSLSISFVCTVHSLSLSLFPINTYIHKCSLEQTISFSLFPSHSFSLPFFSLSFCVPLCSTFSSIRKSLIGSSQYQFVSLQN